MSELDGPSPLSRSRLLAAAARVPATKPGAWRRRAIVATVLGLAWTAALAAVLGARRDWHELPGAALGQTFVVLLAVATLATAAGLTRGRAMVGAASAPLGAAVWGGLATVFILVMAIDPRGPSTRMFPAATTFVHALGCDGLVVIGGAPLAGLGLWVLRDLTLARPGLTGGCVGFAAATWAHAVVRFHCPIGGSMHAVLGHLLPALPLVAAGAWVARARVCDRRARGSGRETPPAESA